MTNKQVIRFIAILAAFIICITPATAALDGKVPFLRDVVELDPVAQAATGGNGYGSNGKFLAPIDPPDPDAIPIYTAQDLDNIRNNLSGSFKLMNDIDLSTFNGGEWVPIGYLLNPFTGIFDGQGYLIYNANRELEKEVET